MIYLTTHSTHFIYGYISVRHVVKDHSDNERGNPFRSSQVRVFNVHIKSKLL